MSTKITTMSYIYECLEEFKKSILNVDKIHVKIVDSDKQFKLECPELKSPRKRSSSPRKRSSK